MNKYYCTEQMNLLIKEKLTSLILMNLHQRIMNKSKEENHHQLRY